MDTKRNYELDTTITASKVCQLLENGKIKDLPLDMGKPIGIAQNIIGKVMLKGLSKGHLGLTTGSEYFYDTNGDISTDDTGTILGYALSDTELLMIDYIVN